MSQQKPRKVGRPMLPKGEAKGKIVPVRFAKAEPNRRVESRWAIVLCGYVFGFGTPVTMNARPKYSSDKATIWLALSLVAGDDSKRRDLLPHRCAHPQRNTRVIQECCRSASFF
jgi:hypothetical protein